MESKDKSKFIVSEKFIVERVLSKTKKYHIQDPRDSNFVGFGLSSHYTEGQEVGQSTTFYLKVRAHEKSLPIKLLEFSGYTGAKAGSYIVAKIPRCEEKGRRVLENERFYVDREFKPKESAIEIAVMAGNLEIERNQSADYDNFVRDEDNFFKE